MRREGGESEGDQENIVLEGKGRKGVRMRRGRLITHINLAPTQRHRTRPRDYRAHRIQERHEKQETRTKSKPAHTAHTTQEHNRTHRTGTQEHRPPKKHTEGEEHV